MTAGRIVVARWWMQDEDRVKESTGNNSNAVGFLSLRWLSQLDHFSQDARTRWPFLRVKFRRTKRNSANAQCFRDSCTCHRRAAALDLYLSSASGFWDGIAADRQSGVQWCVLCGDNLRCTIWWWRWRAAELLRSRRVCKRRNSQTKCEYSSAASSNAMWAPLPACPRGCVIRVSAVTTRLGPVTRWRWCKKKQKNLTTDQPAWRITTTDDVPESSQGGSGCSCCCYYCGWRAKIKGTKKSAAISCFSSKECNWLYSRLPWSSSGSCTSLAMFSWSLQHSTTTIRRTLLSVPLIPSFCGGGGGGGSSCTFRNFTKRPQRFFTIRHAATYSPSKEKLHRSSVLTTTTHMERAKGGGCSYILWMRKLTDPNLPPSLTRFICLLGMTWPTLHRIWGCRATVLGEVGSHEEDGNNIAPVRV